MAGVVVAVGPPAVWSAPSKTAVTMFPVDEATEPETHTWVDCHRATGSCDFTVGADLLTPEGVSGFPSDLWSRQSTEIRPTNRLA